MSDLSEVIKDRSIAVWSWEVAGAGTTGGSRGGGAGTAGKRGSGDALASSLEGIISTDNYSDCGSRVWSKSSSKPDHGKLLSGHKTSGPGGAGEGPLVLDNALLQQDEDLIGASAGRKGAYVVWSSGSAHNSSRTCFGVYRATQFFFQQFTKVLFHYIQVLLAKEAGLASAFISSQIVDHRSTSDIFTWWWITNPPPSHGPLGGGSVGEAL